MEQAATNCQISANNRWFQKPAKDLLVQAGIPPTLVIPWQTLFRYRPMSVPGLSLLGLKRIRRFVSILRSINPTIIIISVCTQVCHLRRLKADLQQNFFPYSHLCLVVYMCPIPICDTQCPICDSNFLTLGGKKIRCQVN